MRRTVVLIAASVLVAGAGCSSSPKQAQTLPAPAANTTTFMATPTTSTGPATAAASTADLTSSLLTVDDMPAGWTTTPPSADSGGVASCSALDNRSWQQLPNRAEADFQGSSLGPFLAEKLVSGTAAQISAAWSAFAQATAQCSSFSTKSSDGTTQKFTLSGLSFPSYGDATYAFAVTVSNSGLNASGDVVIVRKGAELVEVMALAIGNLPVSLVEQAVSKAVAKA